MIHSYRQCERCGSVMVGVIDGPHAPSRTVCYGCGGDPLSQEQREMIQIDMDEGRA